MLYDLAHLAGWAPCSPHDVAHVSTPLTTANKALDDLQIMIYLTGVWNLFLV